MRSNSENILPSYHDGEVAFVLAQLAMTGGTFLDQRRKGELSMYVDLVASSDEVWPQIVDDQVQSFSLLAESNTLSSFSRTDNFELLYVKDKGGQYDYRHVEQNISTPKAGATRNLNEQYSSFNGSKHCDGAIVNNLTKLTKNHALALAKRLACAADMLPAIPSRISETATSFTSESGTEIYPSVQHLVPLLGRIAAIAANMILRPYIGKVVAATIQLDAAPERLRQRQVQRHTSDNFINIFNFDKKTGNGKLFSIEAWPTDDPDTAVTEAKLEVIHEGEDVVERYVLNQVGDILVCEEFIEVNGEREGFAVSSGKTLSAVLSLAKQVMS